MRNLLNDIQNWIDDKGGLFAQAGERAALGAGWTALGSILGLPLVFGLGAIQIILYDEFMRHQREGSSLHLMKLVRLFRVVVPTVVIGILLLILV